MKKNFRIISLIVVFAMISQMFIFTNVSYATTLTKSPYLQDVKTTTAVVMWETTVSEAGSVEYGTTSTTHGNYQSSVTASSAPMVYDIGTRYIYKATLTGLSANTKYYYRVNSGSTIETERSFYSAKNADTNQRFLITGDTQDSATNNLFISAFNNISTKPDFLLHVGDITAANPIAEAGWNSTYFTPFKDIMGAYPIYYTMGNHDVEGNADATPMPSTYLGQERFYEAKFSLPAEVNSYPNYPKWNYAFTRGDIFFVSLYDDERLHHEGGPGKFTDQQRNWLNTTLKSPEALRAKWKIVFFHQWDLTAPDNVVGRIWSIIKGNDVDLVVDGHKHKYQFMDHEGQKNLNVGLGYNPLNDPSNTGTPSYAIFDTNVSTGAMTMNSYVCETTDRTRFVLKQTHNFTNTYTPTDTRVAFQQGINSYTGSKDSYIQKSTAANNYGSATTFKIKGAGSDESMGLMSYDLTSIPQDAIITSAELRLTCTVGTNAVTTDNISIYKALTQMNPGTSNGAAQTGESTWNSRMHASATWGAGTAKPKAGTDYDATALDTTAVTLPIVSSSDWDSIEFDVTSAVSSWVATPSSNLGFIIGSTNTTDTLKYVTFASDNNSLTSIRPALYVTYNVPAGATPTPTLAPTPTPTPTPVITPTAIPGGAGQSIFQQNLNGYTSAADTRVKSSAATTNYSATSPIRLSNWDTTTDVINYPIIKFDNIVGTGLVPAGAVVTSAYLDVTVSALLASTYSDTVDIFPVLASGVNISQATWNVKSSGVNWAGYPNGPLLGTDYGSSAIASQTLGGAGSVNTHVQIPIPYSLVQSWVDNSANNKGLLMKLRNTSATDQYIDLYSAEGTQAYRPQLIVNWTTATPSQATFQQNANGYTSAADTRVKSSSPTSNYSAASPIRLSNWDTTVDVINYPILKFDNIVGGAGYVPAGAIVTSVYLDVAVAALQTSTYSDTVNVFPMLATGVNISQATWSVKASGVAWASGANGPLLGTDYGSTSLGSLTLGGAGSINTHVQIPLSKTLFQSWVDNSATNLGLLMKLQNTSATDQFIDIYSAEGTQAYRPKLIINYVQ